MWIVNLFTDYIVSLLSFVLTIVGMIGFMGSTFASGTISWVIPFIRPYMKPLQAVSVLILCVGVFLRGDIYRKHKYDIQLKTAQAKIEALEAKGSLVTEKIKYVTKEKIVYITNYESNNLHAIDNNVGVIDKWGVIPDLSVDIYNNTILQR